VRPTEAIRTITDDNRLLGAIIRDKYEIFVRVVVSWFLFSFSFFLFPCGVGRK